MNPIITKIYSNCCQIPSPNRIPGQMQYSKVFINVNVHVAFGPAEHKPENKETNFLHFYKNRSNFEVCLFNV